MLACAGGDKIANGDRSPVVADSDSAASRLLTIDDFPDGWVHRPPQPGEVDDGSTPGENAYGCPVGPLVGETDRAFGGEYSNANTTMLSVNPTVHVFETAAAAAAALDELYARSECFARAVGDGLDLDASFAFGKTTIEERSPDVVGADRLFRVANTQIYKDAGQEDVLWFDSALVVEGRFLYRLDGFQRHEPIDQELLKTYVEIARERIDP
jgi:hypothetical protein